MIVLMGKSSSGKDRISNELKKHGYKKIVRYSTRPRRKGEKDDTYNYISINEFDEKIKSNFFCEWKDYFTASGLWYYGTALEDVENADDKTVIILPPDRYKEVKENIKKDFICIYIYANNETLKKRLEKRGDDKGEAERRLKHDNEDFKGAEYLADKIVYNNDGTNINDVVNKILEFIGAKNE